MIDRIVGSALVSMARASIILGSSKHKSKISFKSSGIYRRMQSPRKSSKKSPAIRVLSSIFSTSKICGGVIQVG
jgi:hypothetical protein